MVHMSITRYRAFVACVALGATLPLQAQSDGTKPRSNTKGFMVGAHLNGSSLAYEGDDAESGGGLGIVLGYGFSPKWQLTFQVDAANIDLDARNAGAGSYTLSHGDLGVRYTFANTARAWVPYLSAAVSSRIASASIDQTLVTSSDVTLSGPAVSLGGGVQYFFSQKVALDIGLLFSGGKFDNVKVGSLSVDLDNAENSNSTRFNIGLTFYPQVKR